MEDHTQKSHPYSYVSPGEGMGRAGSSHEKLRHALLSLLFL